MRNLARCLSTLFLYFVLAPDAFAASFDCKKASTDTEIAICADPALSVADELIAAAYRTIKTLTSDREKLLNEQRHWLIERDKVLSSFKQHSDEYNSAEDKLHGFMSMRFGNLLRQLVGSDYDIVANLFSSSAAVSYESDRKKRVIIYSLFGADRATYNNALFFDQDRKLVKVFMGEIYEYSACEENFSLEEVNSPTQFFTYGFSCGSGRHGFSEYSYSLRRECIAVDSYGRYPGQLSDWTGEYYEFLEPEPSCLENFDFDFDASLPDIVTGTLNAVNPNPTETDMTSGLLNFLKNYWQDPPVLDLRSTQAPESTQCNTNQLALTRIKLINLYQHFTLDDEKIAARILHYPKTHDYILQDSWNWDYNYKLLLDIYEQNAKTIDGLLPSVKLLDDDGSIRNVVDYLIASKTDPDLKVFKFENQTDDNLPSNCAYGPYFVGKKDDLMARIFIQNQMEPYNPTIKLRSFWERRELDGTAEITMNILIKLHNALN